MFVDTTWTKDRVLVEIPDFFPLAATTGGVLVSREDRIPTWRTIDPWDLPEYVEPAPLSSYMELFQ